MGSGGPEEQGALAAGHTGKKQSLWEVPESSVSALCGQEMLLSQGGTPSFLLCPHL